MIAGQMAFEPVFASGRFRFALDEIKGGKRCGCIRLTDSNPVDVAGLSQCEHIHIACLCDRRKAERSVPKSDAECLFLDVLLVSSCGVGVTS